MVTPDAIKTDTSKCKVTIDPDSQLSGKEDYYANKTESIAGSPINILSLKPS